MAWYILFDNTTGRLESIATVIAENRVLQAKGLTKRELSRPPDLDTEVWDEKTKDFVPRVIEQPRDLIDIILNDPQFPNVDNTVKEQMRQVGTRILGNRRFAGE